MGAPPQPPQQPRQERGPRSAAAEPAGSDDWRSGRGRAPHAAPARRSPPQKRPMPEPAEREGPAAVEKEAPLSPEELERQKKRRLEEIAAARAKQEAENKRLAEERRKRVDAAKLAASSRPKVGVAGERAGTADFFRKLSFISFNSCSKECSLRVLLCRSL